MYVYILIKRCECLQKNYLAYMGVPMKNGGHVLFPEEVLFLMEVNATDGCRPLSLYDGIQIMGECGVPLYKYCAYAALRRAGFIVLRPDYLRSFFTVIRYELMRDAMHRTHNRNRSLDHSTARPLRFPSSRCWLHGDVSCGCVVVPSRFY
ncbi:unnamed protein product [Heligmosomoides polygyrus]|uniref:tRNA_int_end_N2 domain-containing protein n=1 Tax=Heligmosomoides polygyrus TaxID=6339 RepID=A0A183F7U7_HELPZ|nr:unnamed protein product [Heligmosomoides polygyrus]